jgi:hypothetical protein
VGLVNDQNGRPRPVGSGRHRSSQMSDVDKIAVIELPRCRSANSAPRHQRIRSPVAGSVWTGCRRAEAQPALGPRTAGSSLVHARQVDRCQSLPHGMVAMIFRISSTEKPRSVWLRVLPSEPAFSNSAIAASSLPSAISTAS